MSHWLRPQLVVPVCWVAIGFLGMSFLGFGPWAQSAQATVMVEIPLEQLTDEADAIVLGTVISTGSRFVLVDGIVQVHTITRVRVERWLKGVATSVVLIDQLGGRYQNTVTWPTGTPEYAVGEQVLVFLERVPEVPDGYRTAQLCQGKFSVNDGIEGVSPTLVQRDTSGISFASWADNGEMAVEAGTIEPAIPLSDLVQFLERRVQASPSTNPRTL